MRRTKNDRWFKKTWSIKALKCAFPVSLNNSTVVIREDNFNLIFNQDNSISGEIVCQVIRRRNALVISSPASQSKNPLFQIRTLIFWNCTPTELKKIRLSLFISTRTYTTLWLDSDTWTMCICWITITNFEISKESWHLADLGRTQDRAHSLELRTLSAIFLGTRLPLRHCRHRLGMS